MRLRALGKDQDGYALVEIILSIGILAVVSLYFMNMFVLADSAQDKARDLDRACLLAQSAFESARGGGQTGTFYYDGDWNEISGYDEQGFTLACVLTESAPPELVVGVVKNTPYANVFQTAATHGPETVFELRGVCYERGPAP